MAYSECRVRTHAVNGTCPEKCDPRLFAEKCPGYTQKVRFTTTHAHDNESGPLASMETKWLIVAVIFVMVLLIILLLFIFRKQIRNLVRRLNEALFKRHVRVVPVIGTESYQPVSLGRDPLFSRAIWDGSEQVALGNDHLQINPDSRLMTEMHLTRDTMDCDLTLNLMSASQVESDDDVIYI